MTAVAVLAALVAAALPARAQMPVERLIEAPIGDVWSAPFAAFLKTLGVSDPDALIARTYMFEIGLRQGTIGVRVEHASTCHMDQCFTIIGRLHNKRFVADAMFSAGKRYVLSDRAAPVLGAAVFPAWFIAETTTVSALETPRGWLIVPGPTVGNLPTPNLPAAKLPTANLPTAHPGKNSGIKSGTSHLSSGYR